MFSLAMLMILAWKIAGFIGVDRFLLPILGALWNPGRIFQGRASQAPSQYIGSVGVCCRRSAVPKSITNQNGPLE